MGMRRLLVVAFLLLAAPAQAAWERPQAIDPGQAPHVRIVNAEPLIGYAKGSAFDPSQLLVSAGNEPFLRVKVPRPGRVVAFDVDGDGQVVALRDARRTRRSPHRVIAYEENRWRAISPATTSAVDAKLAVAESGAAVAAWMQYEGRRVFVTATVRPRGALRFGAPQRISGPTTRIQQPLSVAVDDDANAVVAFAEAGDLMMARTVGASFTVPVGVHDRTQTTAGAFSVATAIRGQVAVVAFTRIEDLEPPEYRLAVATQTGDAAPVVETVATDVSAFDIDAAVPAEGTPLVLGTPIGPPYSLRLFRRAEAWSELATFPAGDAPSTIRLAVAKGAGGPTCVTWTEGPKGFAAIGEQRLSLGQAADVDCAVQTTGRAIAAWNRGGGSNGQRLARFTP
jgi:hypothetical protein